MNIIIFLPQLKSAFNWLKCVMYLMCHVHWDKTNEKQKWIKKHSFVQ